MVLDFTKAKIPKNKPKRVKYTNMGDIVRGSTKYRNDKFTILCDDGNEYDVNDVDLFNAKLLYSRPCNDKHEEFTKRKNNNRYIDSKLIRNYKLIVKFWCTIIPDRRVKGYIVDEKFIIRY